MYNDLLIGLGAENTQVNRAIRRVRYEIRCTYRSASKLVYRSACFSGVSTNISAIGYSNVGNHTSTSKDF